MANLRLVIIKAFDSTTIRAKFTENLDPLINVANVSVTSNTPGVPDPRTLMVTVAGAVLTITVRPLTPYASYAVEFRSTDEFRFRSKSGTSYLFEDGKTNVPWILGPENPADPIRDSLTTYLKDNVYNVDSGTLVRDIVNSQANLLSTALYAIRQAKSDNYLSVTIYDEMKTRGSGPFDRLNEEGAYQIVRVGKNPTGSTTETTIDFTEFPSGPVTLLTTFVTNETLEAGAGSATFNELVLTTDNRFVTKLNSVEIVYQNGDRFTYDVTLYGYQIKEPRYDLNYASPMATLSDDQFKLSDAVLSDGFVLPVSGDVITIDYEHQTKGRIIDSNSVTVSQVLDAVREVAPPIVTQFNLDHSPVVTSIDTIPTTGTISFLDPNSNPPFSETHPAFTRQIPFKFDGLPSRAGEYSVDYENGTIYVYGEEDPDGTGDFPPVITYQYRKTFKSRLDYTYDPDLLEIVANPMRDLVGDEAKITFDFENVYAAGVDFNPQVHTEVLNERIDNRLRSTNSLSTSNSPITNVFRILNETSGELYRVQRWNDSVVYFTSSTPPNIVDQKTERISFTDVANEVLLLNTEFVNALSTRVMKFVFENNRVMSASEDSIGSSFNSSVTFSRSDIFTTELYYDAQVLDTDTNTDRLEEGQYQIDYRLGILYVGVSAEQNLDLGTVNYKKSTIAPQHSHLVSISELYHSLNPVVGVGKRLSYVSFTEGEVIPASFDVSDERFTDGDTDFPYIVSEGTVTVTDDIKEVRNVFDAYDLNNSVVPTNFGEDATITANVITLSDGIEKQEAGVVLSGGTIEMPAITPGAEIVDVISITRISDSVDLWATAGSFSDYTITLSGVSSPMAGDEVIVIYQLALNGAATPIVDYNRGEYFMDYSYLADEILISYEYGDNSLDFRESDSIGEGEQYFVTYKIGALRDSLLKNFGALVNIPILNTFDTSLPRENYRDALRAAIQSFTKGPTLPSMKAVVSNITHIDPEIIEAAFQNWSLGMSHLYLSDFDYTGDIQLLTGKFDHGVLMTNADETITFPISSNLRLDEGTLETWIIPEWDGLDNDATLTVSIEQDGYTLDVSRIWIGADSHHPEYTDDNTFVLNKSDDSSPIGLPSAVYTQTGMFIYYDDDVKRWKMLVRETTETDHVFSGSITSSGEVYDVKFIPGLKEINDVLRSRLNKIEFELHVDANDETSPDGYVDGYSIVDGYTPGDGYVAGYSFDGFDFMADDEHYIFDFGKTETTNRFSLFKDGKGYLNFRVYDRGGNNGAKHRHDVTADISDWEAGHKYHVAVTWRINSSDRRDELHLFINGVEVPNIMHYGGRPVGGATDRFRTIKPEYVAGTVPYKAIAGNDLVTTLGSSTVTSDSVDFESEGIIAGGTLDIDETGFSSYTILSVSGSSLVLDASMPGTLSDARFSVNKYAVVVASAIDLYGNIAVSILRDGEETEIPGLRATIPSYAVSKNALNQNVLTILGNADAGDQIVIRTFGQNHRRCRDRKFIWGDTSSIIKTRLPPPINLDAATITAVPLPLVAIGPANSTLSLGEFTATLQPTQPTNSDEGRTLSVRVTRGNVVFPMTVTINGTTESGAVFETLTFTAAGTQTSAEKFKTITSAVVVVTPIVTTRNSVSVEIKEAYSITYPDGNESYPIIRFSYKTQMGTDLEGTAASATLIDTEGYFTESNVGQKLVITSPGSVAGTYTIESRVDGTTITVDPALAASFTGGTYDIYNVTLGRSGFQNGFFVFEEAGSTNVDYPLAQGWYEFDYSSHLEIPFDHLSSETGFIGSDMNGAKQARAIIDEFRILSKRITDVRIGETLAENQDSITTDYTALRPFQADSNTLVLLHLDELPIYNSADFWISSQRGFMQAANSVNENFGQSLAVTERPLVLDNAGLLSTASEGSVEFWVSPRYDTYNDPVERFYFDASGSALEEVTSLTSTTVQVEGSVSSIISVRLATDTANTGTDYYAGGSLASDFQTIQLTKELPSQQTPLRVNYVPLGLSGDRISIYKDTEGYIVFNVRADDIDYQVRQPVFWQRDTWHRIQATYKFNRADNQDEIRLFVDGEERGVVMFGSGLLFGDGTIFGQGFAGVDDSVLISDINFADPINEFSIGSDYFRTKLAQARIDNVRLSNTSRRPISVAGQPKDVNYSSNIDSVYPVVEDAFTTYLLNFDSLLKKADDFALLKDEAFGIFDFTLNIIDSFGIVSGNPKIKQILEKLIAVLKPAQSRAKINYE